MGRRSLALVTAAAASLTIGAAPADAPRSYLLSITVPLARGERIENFKIKTWGVTFKAICHMPDDWEFTAGAVGMGGRFEGQAGHGVAFIGSGDLLELKDVALIDLAAPVQWQDKPIPNGVISKTLDGYAVVDTGTGQERRVTLTSTNLKLTPARRCG